MGGEFNSHGAGGLRAEALALVDEGQFGLFFFRGVAQLFFFDGELAPGGNYRFSSMSGNINLRIPFNASFRLVATAPSTRNISLGVFGAGNLNYLGDGRRVVGRFGDGSATLSVTNQRGSIGFLRR